MARAQEFITINPSQMAEIRDLLAYIKDGVQKVIMRALNKTIVGVRSDAAKEIYKELNLTQTRIKEDMALRKATMIQQTAAVTSKGKHIPLIEFGARIVRSGVSVQVKRTRPRTVIEGAFIQTVAGRGPQVLSRPYEWIGKGTPIGMPKAGYYYTYPARWPEKYRLPAMPKYGPSIPEVFSNDEVMGPVLEQAGQRLQINLDHEAKYLISQNIPSDDGYTPEA